MIVAVGFGALIPFVAIYLEEQVGLTPTKIGLVMLVSAVVSASGRIIGGELADRVGRLFVIRSVLILRIFAFLLLAFLAHMRANWLWIVAAFALTRFIGAAIRPAVGALVADIIPPADRVKAYGLMKVGHNVGWAVGAAGGGFVLATLDYPALFAAPGIASLIGLVLAARWLTETAGEIKTGQFDFRDILSVLADRRFVAFCGCCLLLFLLMGQYLMTFSLYMKNHVGIAKHQVGYVYSLNGGLVVLLQWPISLVVAGMAMRKPLVAGCLLLAMGFLSVAAADSLAMVFASMAIITLGEMIFTPAASTAVAKMAPPDRMGRYMGLYGLAEAVGWSAGPAIGGVLLGLYAAKPALTPLIIWAPVASLGILAAAGFWIVIRKRKPTREGAAMSKA